ncbi:MAG: malate dehydrogenase, partial [Chloroflexi bacterium]|nr:malate dehydrogenase [Chloroflexota bacterium]
NTNCLIAMHNAPDIPRERFTAMTRLDHNRAMAQLAQKAGVAVSDVKHVTIWGNHSSTQYPDAYNATIQGKPAPEVIGDDEWIKGIFIPTVQKRGAAIIEARGQSSAASAANAAINHVQTWYHGTPEGDWTSMGIPSTGAYGAPADVIFSYPVTIRDGVYQVVEGLPLNDFAQERLLATSQELLEEREAVLDSLHP